MADVNVRRSQHVVSKAAEEEEEQLKRVTAALEYEALPCFFWCAAITHAAGI